MIAESKMYPESNTLFVSLQGFADVEDTVAQVDRLEIMLGSLPIRDMSLIIDCNDMAPFKQDILPMLERCYGMYNGFKHAVLVNPTKMVARSQLQRVASTAGFTGHFVDTVEEAWVIAKS